MSAGKIGKRTIVDKVISGCIATKYFLSEPIMLNMARLRYGILYRDKSKRPLVSVVMATFKRAQLVRDRLIPSILNQTYQNFEVILVGDRTLDNTEELIKQLNDPRIRFVHLPEYEHYPNDRKARWCVGGAPAINKALRLAKGLWIAETDDDVSFTPDHIESLLAYAENGGYEFVSAAYMEERYGKRAQVGAQGEQPKVGGYSTWITRGYLKYFDNNIHSWRKAINCPRDLDRQVRMYRAGVKMGYLDKVVTLIFPRPGENTIGLSAVEESCGMKLRDV